jgi:hypothetical protein
VVTERLGHSHTATTMDTDAGYLEDLQEDAAAVVDQIFGRDRPDGNREHSDGA